MIGTPTDKCLESYTYLVNRNQKSPPLHRGIYPGKIVEFTFCDTCKTEKNNEIAYYDKPKDQDSLRPPDQSRYLNGYKKIYNSNKDILLDGEFKNGKLLSYRRWHSKGFLKVQTVYSNGRFNTKFWRHDNAAYLYAENNGVFEYNNGLPINPVRNGIQREWYETNEHTLAVEVFYENGKPINIKCFDTDGKLMKCK